MSEWQTIDTAPPSGQVLITDGVYHSVAAKRPVTGEWITYTYNDGWLDAEVTCPTHWMPLPKPPPRDAA